MNKHDLNRLMREVQHWKSLATELAATNTEGGLTAKQQEIIKQFEKSIERCEKTLISSARKRKIPMADLANGLMQLDRRRR